MLRCCIYCCQEFQPAKGGGDHGLPSALVGEFHGDPRLLDICRPCNSDLKECEEVLMRCAPEGHFRAPGRSESAHRKGESRQLVGAHGLPPPQSFVLHTDHRELALRDPTRDHGVISVDQLIVTRTDGDVFYFRLHPGQTPAALRRWLDSKGIGVPASIRYKCSDSPSAKRLVDALFPNSTSVEFEDEEAGNQTVTTGTVFTFDDRYLRAIAKIGLHYYLLNTRRGYTGFEAWLAPIKQFIRNGGPELPFFARIRGRFALEQPTSSGWRGGHVISIDERSSEVLVGILLFHDLAPDPLFHLVRIGDAPHAADPSATSGHVYRYELAESGKRRGIRDSIRVVTESARANPRCDAFWAD